MKIKNKNNLYINELNFSIKLKEQMMSDIILKKSFFNASKKIVNTLKKKNKIFLIGNGGSAADAQHFASEISSKFQKIRNHLPAIALTTDTSVITSLGNDFGFQFIFSKQIEALANKNDILIAFTTSCKSKNINKAIEIAKKNEIFVILFCGNNVPKKIQINSDIILSVKSNSVPRIQENHIFLYHSICKIIDMNF